jgi:MFS family permease
MGVGGLLLGSLIARLGTWRCVWWGSQIFLLSSLLIAFAETPLPLYLLSATYGFGLAFVFNTTMPFLLEWSSRHQRAQVAAVSFSLISLSVTIGSLMGGLLPDAINALFPSLAGSDAETLRWTLLIGSAIAGFGLMPIWLMSEARSGRVRPEEAPVAEPTNAAERRQVRSDMGIFILSGGLMSLGVGMVIPFYNVYLTTLGADAREVGFIFALGSAVAAVIGLSAPAVARHLGSLNAVFLLRVSIVPFYLLLIVAPTLPIAVIAHLVRQTSISMAWPIDSTFIGELLPPRARTSVFGLRSAAWNFVSALAAFVAGKIIVRTGYDWTFVSIAGFTALSAIVFTLYYRRHPAVRGGLIPSALPTRQREARVAAAQTE